MLEIISKLDQMGFTRVHTMPVAIIEKYKNAIVALRDLGHSGAVSETAMPIAIEIPLRNISLPEFQINN